MKKIIILLLIFLIFSCALFRTPEEKARIAEEQARIDKEENRLTNCAKQMKIIDANNTKPYEIIDIVALTYTNGYEEYVFDYLKRQACGKGGDALTMPEMQAGFRNTTYTAKVIVWKK